MKNYIAFLFLFFVCIHGCSQKLKFYPETWNDRHEGTPTECACLPELYKEVRPISDSQAQTQEKTENGSYLSEKIVPYQPLKASSHIEDNRTIPAKLEKFLFPDEKHYCYILMDSKRDNNLCTELQNNNVPFRKLYEIIRKEPELEEEPYYHEVLQKSPYIFKLDKTHEIARRLFAYDPEQPDTVNLWRYHGATFIVSPLDFDTLFYHIRSYAIIRNPQNGMLYLNIHYPEILSLYLHNNARRPTRLASFFGLPDEEKITRVAMEFEDGMHIFSVKNLAADITAAPVVLDEADMQILIDKYNREVLFPPLADQLFSDLPELKDQYSKKQLVEKFMNNTRQLKQYNIKNSYNVYQTVLYDLLFGEDWPNLDPEDKIWQIIKSDGTDDEKYCRLKHRMAYLEEQGIVKYKGVTH